MGLLHTRTKKFDNVLLMAHGSSNAILTTTHNPSHQYTTYITADEADAFINDFVFAISCSTANEFGQTCVNKGAIAYLGYQVNLGPLFYSFPDDKYGIPKSVSTAVDTIIKHIFIEELSCAYEEFLTTPINVNVLREQFSFLLERKFAELSNMNVQQLNEEYNVRLSENYHKKFFVTLTLQALSYLNDILPRLVCIGDGNYISSSYIAYEKEKGVSQEKLAEELESNTAFKKLLHTPYKQYLRELVAL